MNWVIYLERMNKQFYFIEINDRVGFAKWGTNHKKAKAFNNHDKATEFVGKYLKDKKVHLKAIV